VILFLIVFFLIYGSVHYYFFHKLSVAFLLPPALSAGLVAFLAAMVLAPVAVRLLEQEGHETTARAVAFLGYCWMGFLFLFFAAALAGDLLRLLLWLGRQLTPLPAFPSPAAALSCCLALALTGCVYGWAEALRIRTEHVTIATGKLPTGVDRLRIVQISDVHVGLIVREERLRRMVAAIGQAAPDLLVSTGDLVDGHVADFHDLSGMFRDLTPRLGKYAITGNHEYYAGLEQAVTFTRQAGFHLLRGEAIDVAGMLTVAGIDDPAGKRFPGHRQQDEAALLAPLDRQRFVLYLKHRPVVSPQSAGRFDLQLSGHVHKGQIFPFNLLTWLNFPVRAGLTPLPTGGAIYVSRGTGTWGPPLRVFAPPEVTIIDLVATPSPRARHAELYAGNSAVAPL
jgi:predicted MPP superfamily phosphohydrolase